eukprot:13743935-Alexandrium_andersonii.AAC.1
MVCTTAMASALELLALKADPVRGLDPCPLQPEESPAAVDQPLGRHKAGLEELPVARDDLLLRGPGVRDACGQPALPDSHERFR